jgi:DNA-binding GntR family transcriptional regulator
MDSIECVVYTAIMPAINTPTYQLVRDLIRSDIVEGVWPLGSHMTMTELVGRYGVSANPVREALQQLQGEGVIELRMNRGAVVPQVDARYIDNIYKLRAAVQVMLAREAAQRITAAQAERLRELCELHETAVAEGDAAACVRCNRELHHFMDQLADNPPAMEVLASRLCLIDAFRRSVGFSAGRLDKVVAQHRRLVRAITRGDADLAARVAHEHTESARLDLLAALQSRKA